MIYVDFKNCCFFGGVNASTLHKLACKVYPSRTSVGGLKGVTLIVKESYEKFNKTRSCLIASVTVKGLKPTSGLKNETLSCSHLNFRYRACFEQGAPWHSGNYRVWIHPETRTCHNKNIQSNVPYIWIQHSSIIWPFLLNGWVFDYELNGCGFESCCSHLKL